ncbi:hypothetical protein ABPG72_003898 [Tetrahymena utriculariae]
MKWDEYQVVDWLKKQIVTNLSPEQEKKWIENKYCGNKLQELNEKILEEELLIRKIQKNKILKVIKDILSQEKQDALSFIQEIEYTDWTTEQLINWMNSCCTEKQLNEEQIIAIQNLGITGQDLDDLDGMYLRTDLKVQEEQQINLILESLKNLQNQNNAKKEGINQFTQPKNQFEANNTGDSKNEIKINEQNQKEIKQETQADEKLLNEVKKNILNQQPKQNSFEQVYEYFANKIQKPSHNELENKKEIQTKKEPENDQKYTNLNKEIKQNQESFMNNQKQQPDTNRLQNQNQVETDEKFKLETQKVIPNNQSYNLEVGQVQQTSYIINQQGQNQGQNNKIQQNNNVKNSLNNLKQPNQNSHNDKNENYSKQIQPNNQIEQQKYQNKEIEKVHLNEYLTQNSEQSIKQDKSKQKDSKPLDQAYQDPSQQAKENKNEIKKSDKQNDENLKNINQQQEGKEFNLKNQQNLISKYNPSLNDIFLNEQQMVNYQQNCQQNEKTFTFYCYFKEFSKSNYLKLSIFKDKKLQSLRNYEVLVEEYMLRIPNTNIFYLHINLLDKLDLKYQYSLDFYNQRKYQFTSQSRIIERSFFSLSTLNRIIFDTPNEFGKFCDYSKLMLQSYTILYAQYCDVISGQYLLQLSKFIEHVVQNKYSQQELLVLKSFNDEFKKLSQLKKIIYAGALQSFEILKKFNHKLDYQLQIEEVQSEFTQYQKLPEEMKKFFGLGFQHLIKQSQLIDALKLPKEMREFIPDSIWDFQIYMIPQDHVIIQIDFNSLKQTIRDNLFFQISKIYGITFKQLQSFIQSIKPSDKYQIDSIKNFFITQRNPNQKNNSMNQELIEYFAGQTFLIQKQLILCEEIRQIVLQNENFIQLSIELLIKNTNEEVNKISFEERVKIINDILENLKRQPKSVFKNQFINLLYMLNEEGLSNKQIGYRLLSIIQFAGYKECYELIQSINFNFKNEALENTLIQSITTILKDANLEQNEYCQHFQQIINCSFFNVLNNLKQNDLLIMLFNMITSLLPQNENEDKLKLIENKHFLENLDLLKRFDLITKCDLLTQIIDQIKILISSLRQRHTKLLDLRRLLKVEYKKLLNFLEVVNLQLDDNSLEETLNQIVQYDNHMTGLKQFAYFMEDLEIPNYQQMEAHVKNYFEKNQDMLLEEFTTNQKNEIDYKCLKYLYQFNHIPMVYNYIKSNLMDPNKQNRPQSEIELDVKIINIISEIKNHLVKINGYKKQNDSLNLNEIFRFWSYTFKGIRAYNKIEIFQFINELQIYFNQNEQHDLQIQLESDFIQDIIDASQFYQSKDIVEQVYNTINILAFSSNEKYQKDYTNLQELTLQIKDVEQSAQNKQQNFSLFIEQIRQYLNKIKEYIPQKTKSDIQNFVSVVKNTKKLIEYLNQLDRDKIQLEDLVDIIDDTSMETDALVQEMMNVRNALQLIRAGEEDNQSLIGCFASRYQKYELNLKKNYKLEGTINRCLDNLDVISLKIQSQSDKSTQILQTIKNLENSITVQIERQESQSESQLLFVSSREQNQKIVDQVLNFEEFNLLCNRFKLIKSNKKNTQYVQQEQQQADDSKEKTYNNLIQVLQLSEQIRQILDNLKNLGHTEFVDNRYAQKNSLKSIIQPLEQDLEQLKEKNQQHINQLCQARQQYLSLNFYPPYSFELILKLKNCINNENQSKVYLNQLSKLTMFINERQEPNLESFKKYIAEQQAKNDTEGMDLYGKALNILLNFPKVDIVENKPEQLATFTQGNQIEVRRIKSYSLLLKSIVTIFLAHNQKPTSWQIFFCSSKTHILDLEQFAYLAKNASQNETYKKQKPLFLICQFENLSIIVQRQFIDKLTEMYEENNQINLLITYIGNFEDENSMHILQQFKYAFQVDSQLTNFDLVQFSKIESLKTISIYFSKYSGFGKTFQIRKKCKQNNQKLIEIPIYGETTKLELINLFQKKLEAVQNNQAQQYRLHLNLYDLKSDEIHSILVQLLILRKLSHSSSYFAQIPSQMQIEIEIQNTFLDVFEKKIKYLQEYIDPNNIFKYDLTIIFLEKPVQKSILGADLEKFEIDDNPNIKYLDLQLSLQYLKNISRISSFQIQDPGEGQEQKLIQYLQQNQVNQKEAIQLIKEHFLHQVQDNISFYHLTCFLKFFCKQVVLFHKTVYLDIQNLGFSQIDTSLRDKVLKGMINTSVPYSCQIMSNNYKTQGQDINLANQSYYDALEQRNKNIKGWDDNLGQSDDFFLTISQDGSLLPIFQKIQSVPQYLQQYCTQIGCQIQDWNNIKNIRDDVLINLCSSTRNMKSVKEELQEKYSDIAITKTIARKICFLYIKINSDIPTLIMGETGVGKTIIVKYLSSIMNSAMFTLDVHAGLTQNEIFQWVKLLIQLNQLNIDEYIQKIDDIDKDLLNDPENEKLNYEKNLLEQFYSFKKNSGNENFNENKIVLFFDEINTNQNIDGILKELLVEKRILGEPLPDNFVPIAAANPYKFKTERDQQENTDSLKISGCDNQQTSKLIYHVYPLAESMNTFIWQFGELQPEDETKIVSQMVKNASVEYNYLANFQQTLIQTITGCQEFSRSKQSIRSVSLRDVSRFLKVFKYFKTDLVQEKSLSESLLFSVFFSYYCRFNSIKLREELCNYLENVKQVTYAEGRKSFQNNIKSVVNEQMELIQGILEYGESYKSIAFTSTLKENLFMILISVLNNIPIIMVGPPGSSKTLCTRLLYNSMKGSKSNIEFFKKLPNLIYKTYQCSTLSTSDSIEKAFKSAKQLDNTIKKSINESQEGAKNIVALILDEIGLAEASKSNPLKILHRLLEYQKNVPMIGLSNWSLDASKMNRVVFSSRPKLSEDELIEAAIALQKRLNPNSNLCLNIVINLAKDSFSYFSQDNNKTFFHGTRDFYNCVIYICNQLKNNDGQIEDSTQKIILTGILRNFGGSRNINQTLGHFKLSLGQNVQQLYNGNLNQFNPTELIKMNIDDKTCRNLMIIANKPDHALQYTVRFCKDRLHKVFQGSDLQDDFTEYNTLKMLNEIITCMEEGYLVIMYSLESLYQSFYDLFNQNYVELGAKNFCRIAIGSDSIRSQVHQNFKVIIIAQSNDVYDQRQNYDPPLLNRFEKQYLELKFLLKENELNIKKDLNQFVQDCSELKSDRRLMLKRIKWDFRVQDMFPIIQNNNKEDILFSLTLKNNNEINDVNIFKKSQYELIDLANFSGIIRAHFLKKLDSQFYNYYLNSQNHNDFSYILEKLSNNYRKQIQDTNIHISDQYEIFDSKEEQLKNITENLILYTIEYKYQHETPKCIKEKNYMEIEVKWLENIDSLKQQVKQFFSSEVLVNLIVISSVSDSITKILYVKRLLQEERQLYEYQQQLDQSVKKQKNFILVIQLVNQLTNFVGISYDKFWQQIYLEETSKPENNYDDLKNYLEPISVIFKNHDNGIYQYILQECLPKILGEFNFQNQRLTQENLKERLHVYKQIMQISTKQDLNQFVINKIIEKIEMKCQEISNIYGKCEWYQLISLNEQENRNNNKFISSLKQYIFKESLAILIQIFYTAEQNNIISSLMCEQLKFEQQDIDEIFEMWFLKFDEAQVNDRNCDQIQIQYPFFNRIRQSIEQFKQIYLEIISDIFQIEQRIQIRINGDNENDNDQVDDDDDDDDDDELIENKDAQIDMKQQQNKLLKQQKKSRQNLKEINIILINFTSVNDPIVKRFSQINPSFYFDNLQNTIEYQWTESNTLKRFVKKIIDLMNEEKNIESYYSILWVNEQIFTQLLPIWKLCEEVSDNIFEQMYLTFEKKIEEILNNHFEDLAKNNQKLNSPENIEKEEDIKENNEDLNILELLWSEILIFSSQLLEIFVLPSSEQIQWIQNLNNLKKCLAIINNFSTTYELRPDEMIQFMSKFNFILKISQCFSPDKDLRSLIQNCLYGQNDGYEFINIHNYQKTKQIFVQNCDKNKENSLVLRLIWQLLKCDCFYEDFLNYDDEILIEIVSSLSNLLLTINYDDISKNQQESHQFIFAKRILQKIVGKMYESFDQNEEEQEQNENLLEPKYNQSFQKMQKIFNKTKIQMTDPICSVIIDIINEYSYYTPEKFLNFIGKQQLDQDQVDIDEARVQKISKFLLELNLNQQDNTLIHIIELKIIYEICKTICKFIYEAYLFNQRDSCLDENEKAQIENIFKLDRVRKNRFIEMLNSSLLILVNQNDKLNPIIPMILVKIFKEVYDFKSLQVLSPYLEAFQNELFESREADNILGNNLKQLEIEFYKDLKVNKKLTNLKKEVDSEINNLPQLQFNLAILITQVIIDKNEEQFNLMIQILNQLNLKMIDTSLIQEIYKLNLDLLQNNKNIQQELQKVFIINLVMTTFLNEDSFISKMYKGKIDIENIFIPFMVDSDAILAIQDELKKTTALRRYQCKNCIKMLKKPFIYTILPCCMPVNNLGKCSHCGSSPIVEDHFSLDIEPPLTSYGKQEPIFVKQLIDYPDYSYYYNQPGFPYTKDVQTIDSFLENRGRVDPGFQQQFSLIQIKKIRNLVEKEQILFGRVFMLSILCFYCHLIKKNKGIEEANRQLGLSSPNDIFQLIHIDQKGNQMQQNSSWNLLLQITQATASNLMSYFVNKIVKNYLIKQSSKDFVDKLSFSEDLNRVKFEKEFVDNILKANELIQIKSFIEQFQQQKKNNNLKQIILNFKIDLLEDQFNYLKQYKHLFRLNPIIKQEDFQRFITLKSEGIYSQLFNKLIYYKEQIDIYSQIYPIQNFLKLFNLKMFDKITKKESAEIKIQHFVKNNLLEKEFNEFKISWNQISQQIKDNQIQIGVDCARIELDDVESELQNVDILCYSEDKASRGYPLYLLLNYFYTQHNSFLELLEKEFSQLISSFQSKKFIMMNKKNFVPPNIFSNGQKNEFAQQFFEIFVEKQSGYNPYLQYEKQEIYDLIELTSEFFEEYYLSISKIEKTDKNDLDIVQLKNFKFKGDFKTINLVREIADKVDQQLYPEIQNNPQMPLLYIDLQNNEICMRLIDILKTAMQFIIKINGSQKLSGEIYLKDFLKYFDIQVSDINLEKEKIKLCHLLSVYELVEKLSFGRLFQDINPQFMVDLQQNQKDVLLQFCNQQSDQELNVFQQAIGRMIVRILCQQNVLLNQKQEIFQLFVESSDDFVDFWGMENKAHFENQIMNSGWSKYSIFEYQSPNAINIGQIHSMYQEIQILKDKKHQQEREKINVQLKRQQIDQEKIQKELIMNNQFVVNEVERKKKIQQRNKKDYR